MRPHMFGIIFVLLAVLPFESLGQYVRLKLPKAWAKGNIIAPVKGRLDGMVEEKYNDSYNT